jgi:defect-in-organelle-trafficking protein DotB
MMYPHEPLRWSVTEFERLFLWAYEQKASDLLVKTNDHIWLNIHGAWSPVTQRVVELRDVNDLLVGLTKQNNSPSRVRSGEEMNFGYEVQADRLVWRRFRVNASACSISGTDGIAIVLRTLPNTPPSLSELELEQGILDHIYPPNGLVIITGVMGSGKSTLLASAIREMRATQSRMIRTYESPIEFDLTSMDSPRSPIVQMDIPFNLKSWESAPRNASRSASNVILVGEANDRTTMRGMLHLAQMGVAAYTTAHTQSVAETPSRIIDVFAGSGGPDGGDERLTVASTLISSLRLIVHQRLVPMVGGGRVALREYLAFPEDRRRELQGVPLDDLIPSLREMVASYGKRLMDDATEKHTRGLISPEVYAGIVREFNNAGPKEA